MASHMRAGRGVEWIFLGGAWDVLDCNNVSVKTILSYLLLRKHQEVWLGEMTETPLAGALEPA